MKRAYAVAVRATQEKGTVTVVTATVPEAIREEEGRTLTDYLSLSAA